MKKIYFGLIGLMILFVLMQYFESHAENENLKVHQEETTTIEKQLRHVVLFKFKESATPANIHAVEEAFAALPAKID